MAAAAARGHWSSSTRIPRRLDDRHRSAARPRHRAIHRRIRAAEAAPRARRAQPRRSSKPTGTSPDRGSSPSTPSPTRSPPTRAPGPTASPSARWRSASPSTPGREPSPPSPATSLPDGSPTTKRSRSSSSIIDGVAATAWRLARRPRASRRRRPRPHRRDPRGAREVPLDAPSAARRPAPVPRRQPPGMGARRVVDTQQQVSWRHQRWPSHRSKPAAAAAVRTSTSSNSSTIAAGTCPRCGSILTPDWTAKLLEEAARADIAQRHLVGALRNLRNLPGTLPFDPTSVIRNLFEEVGWQYDLAEDPDMLREELRELRRLLQRLGAAGSRHRTSTTASWLVPAGDRLVNRSTIRSGSSNPSRAGFARRRTPPGEHRSVRFTTPTRRTALWLHLNDFDASRPSMPNCIAVDSRGSPRPSNRESEIPLCGSSAEAAPI